MNTFVLRVGWKNFTSAGFGGVVATALVESVLPGLALLVLTGCSPRLSNLFPGLVAYQAKRKKLALTEDSIARVKVNICDQVQINLVPKQVSYIGLHWITKSQISSQISYKLLRTYLAR